jgi:outer membrane receptor for ferrienterochelin and colicins
MRFENPSVGYVVEGNTDLKPEKSRNVNMGVDWAASRSVNLSLSGYRNDVLDLIDYGTLEEGQAGSLTRFGYINVAEAVTQGGELNLQADLWAGFTVVSGYAFTDTLNVQDNRPLEGRPVHQVTGELIQFIEPTQTTVSARGSWNGPKTFFIDTDNDGEENRLTSKPSTLLDARIAQDVSFGRTGFRVFAGVENLLNTGEPVYHAIPPRTFFIGLTGRYPINAVSAAK